MNIWLAPSRYLPHPGGIESATRDVAHALQRIGHHVTIVTHQEPRSLPAEEVLDGLAIARIHFAAPSASLRSMHAALAAGAGMMRRLDALPRPDVVHIHGCASQLLPMTLWSAFRRRPVVLTTHGEIVGDQHRIFERSVYARASVRLGSRRARLLTAPSQWTLDTAAKYASRMRSGIVVPNGVDRHFWSSASPRSSSDVVFTWGRLEPVKGFDRLLRAWPLVLAERPRARLVIGGDGPLREQLLGGLPGVTFPGLLEKEQVLEYLALARAVVVPSRLEAFGLVAAEAATAGRPVVHTGAGALPEVVGTDFQAIPDDPQDLARQIIRALDAPDPTPLRMLTWDEVAERYVTLYRTALRRST